MLLQFSCFYIFFAYFPTLYWGSKKNILETLSSKGVLNLAENFKYWGLGTASNVSIISV